MEMNELINVRIYTDPGNFVPPLQISQGFFRVWASLPTFRVGGCKPCSVEKATRAIGLLTESSASCTNPNAAGKLNLYLYTLAPIDER